jgi:flagellar motor switch protein FliN
MADEQNIHHFLERFSERWANEFGRAIETFTNERPDVAHSRLEGVKRKSWEQENAAVLWWKQEIEGGESFTMWIGAEEPCWSALGKATGDANDPQQVYLEMVAQASQGAAASLSGSFANPLRCGAGALESLPPPESLNLLEVRIGFRGNPLPPLILGIAGAHTDEVSAPYAPADVSRLPVKAGDSPMLDRLMDLQLPVSVLLGRALLPVRDVLKICSGSLVELDRQVGDYVEVMVHGTVVARGEIVSVRGNYGVRIMEIISRQDRIALKDAA